MLWPRYLEDLYKSFQLSVNNAVMCSIKSEDEGDNQHSESVCKTSQTAQTF